MTTFYLLRHGQKENVPFDPPLTAAGRKQAKKVAESLRIISFKAIFASPKTRTMQTAQIIAHTLNIEIINDERLRERLEWDKSESFDAFIDRWNETDLDRSLTPKDGKSSHENGKQLKYFLDEISKNYNESNVLIVTHGGTLGDLLRELFSEDNIPHVAEPKIGARYIEIAECAVTIIQKANDKYDLIKLNDVSHFQDPL